MKRYAAFLRGVTPMNAKMAELKKAFESAGFEDVRTVLSSGNVVFGGSSSSVAAIQRAAEQAMKKHLPTAFAAFVRPVDELRELLESAPYDGFRLDSKAKRIVTFLRDTPESKPKLPVELHGARILRLDGKQVFSAYVPTPKGPVFMTLLEKTFGKDITTRTWDTVAKVAR